MKITTKIANTAWCGALKGAWAKMLINVQGMPHIYFTHRIFAMFVACQEVIDKRTPWPPGPITIFTNATKGCARKPSGPITIITNTTICGSRRAEQ